MKRVLFLTMTVLLLCSGAAWAQEKMAVQVSVTDTNGEPLPGATILEVGTRNSTTADVNGKTTISVPANATLEVSFMGYAPRQVTVTGTTVNVQLEESGVLLDEVVMVGYSTQKRESLTGALQTLSSDKLKTVTTSNVENMLAGKTPGVYVAPGGGRPGDKGSVIIRGKTSINGTADPLWVIDGVIVGNRSDDALNPADIETMTILKDAASTAIYGSEGSNGVIVITTKRAKSEGMTINASLKAGLSTLSNGNLKVMNGAQLYDLYSSASNASTISFPRWNADLRNSNYDWWDLATQTGLAQDYNVSISGGTEKMKSYFSVGMYDEEGAVKGYEYNRYSARFTSEYKPFKWLTIKPSINGSKEYRDDKQYSITAMYSNMPWDSPYLEDGTPTPHMSSTWVNSNSTNYLYDLQYNWGKNQKASMSGNLDVDVKLTDWLTFSSVNNYIWSDYKRTTYTDPRSSGGSGVNGRLEELAENIERRYTNQLLRFNKVFDKHAVNGVLGYEFRDYRYKWFSAAGTGFIPGFEILDVTAKPEATKGSIQESAMQSFFLNANYAYDNKYLLQVSFRRDGASNFGDNAKYGNFYSVSGGWNIHSESFFKVDWVNVLKLRASYGTTGIRPTSLYPQYSLYSVSVKYDELSGLLISQIGNKNLTWEQTATWDIGVDFTAFDRLRFTFDVYNKNTSDVLFNVPISGITGVTSIWQNVGEVQNRGFELTLGADIIKTEDWYWGVDFNLGANKGEVKQLYSGLEQRVNTNISGIAGSASTILKPGYSADTWYLREWAGVNPDTGAPQWYRTDKATGERVVTSTYSQADEVMCGKFSPDFFGGFSTDLRWKNVDFNAVFGYSVGGTIFNYARMEYDADGVYTDRNQMVLHDGWNRWEKPGDVATHPVYTYENKSLSNSLSSRYLEDASYLKLRSLTIGYNMQFPQWHISNLRVYFSAENLFTLTDYSGVDPEIAVKSDTRAVIGVTTPNPYPVTRKFMLGLNITL